MRISVTPAAGQAITRLLADRGAPVVFRAIRWPLRGQHQDGFIRDVAAGPADGFSLPAGDNLHFIILSPACEIPHRVDHELRRLT
jgi:hypothetical protein